MNTGSFHLMLLLVLLLVSAFGAVGCSESADGKRDHCGQEDNLGVERKTLGGGPGVGARALPPVVRLEWREYDGEGDPDAAVFIINGSEVGRGAAGFLEVMGVLHDLPQGSMVVIAYEDRLGLWRNAGPGYTLPFDAGEINQLIEERGDIIVKWE